ncbi:MAG: hypothetical protein QXJ52_01300 [Candidatus Korarchaeota archaeon]|nr:hypothetical protein [Thermoproteota archaeon]
MTHEHLIIQGTTRLDIISKRELCVCSDGTGRLLYDFRKKEFIREGKCKLQLLCTIIHTTSFQRKIKQEQLFIDY